MAVAIKTREPAAEPSPPPPAVAVRRFDLPDFYTPMVSWLIPRLAERYPPIEPQVIAGGLRSIMHLPEYLFIRTDHAVALAQYRADWLMPRAVFERFVLAESKDFVAEAAELYGHISRWATGMGVTEIVVEQFTDVPRPMLRERFSSVRMREMLIARTGK